MSLATAVEPTMIHRSEVFTIATFDGKKAALASAIGFITQPKHVLKHLISPPSKQSDPGFQEVVIRNGYTIPN